jgi:hypothetical protein
MNIQWFHFSPKGSGGSFGRADMGEFCEIVSVLFVLPLLEASIDKAKMTDVEKGINICLASSKPGDVYEWINGTFTQDLTVNWREKLKESVISR